MLLRARLPVVFAFVVVMLAPAVASARSRWQPRPRPQLIDVEVVDGMGDPLRTFQQGGQTFVLGSHGQRYAVLIRNRTADRLEVVLNVDGRDAIRGNRSNVTLDRGYVLAPH